MSTDRKMNFTREISILAFISSLIILTLACTANGTPGPTITSPIEEPLNARDTDVDESAQPSEFSGFSEGDCTCSDLPVDSAIASSTRLGCQYQWEYGSMGETALNRVSMSIFYSVDYVKIQNEYEAHFSLVARNVPDERIQWERGDTSFILVQKQEQSLDEFPFKYYGDVGMIYTSNFVVNISLGGSGFSGEGEVQAILQDVINCAVTLIDR